MRKLIWITGIVIGLVVFILGIYIYRSYNKEPMKIDTQNRVKKVVSSYYDNMQNKQYDKALSLINYGSSIYKNDLDNLINIKNYNMDMPKGMNQWVRGLYYDSKAKDYIVETSAEIKYNGSSWVASEMVFVKNVKGQLKIMKIITDDRYSSLRGSKVFLLGR